MTHMHRFAAGFAIAGLNFACAAQVAVGQLCDVSEVVDLLPDNPKEHPQLGRAVAADGNTLAVGAIGSEAVFVYERIGGEWVYQTTLYEDRKLAGASNLGFSIAISGDTIVAGRGVLYVFVRNADVWERQAVIFPPPGPGAEEFGHSVAISGDYLVVGSPLTYTTYERAGAAYIYERNGANWSLRATITVDDPPISDYLGEGVAISGDTAMIGVPLLDGETTLEGAVLIYQRIDGVWQLQTELRPVFEDTNRSTFGGRLATDGTRLLAGARLNDGATGLVQVFRRVAGIWQVEALLEADDAVNFNYFGDAVAIDGNLAVVGASVLGGGPGAAYVFRRTASGWSQEEKIVPPDDYGNTRMGRGVALAGAEGFIGAPNARIDNRDNVGVVRIIDIACVPLYGDIDQDDDVDFDDFVLLLGAWGDCPAGPDTCPADLDGDGDVDNDDFTALLAHWT